MDSRRRPNTSTDAGASFDWASRPPCQTTNLDEASSDSEELRFDCEQLPLRRIRRFKNLRWVWLYGVNQNSLEDIVRFSKIHSLYIERLTANDLSVLSRLPELRRLILKNAPKIQNLDWVVGLKGLESFAIESFDQAHHLDPLASLTKLSALAVEGTSDAPMHVTTLTPLSGLCDLRYLALGCLRVSDGSLKPLHSLIRLQLLQCGADPFNDDEFIRLHRALPGLLCEWFDMIERHGSIDAGMKSFMEGLI